MNIYRSIDEVPYDKNTVLAVGSFDGLHLGHLSVLERLIDLSEEDNLRNLLVTFDPHPQVFFQSQTGIPFSLLTTSQEKISTLEDLGIDNVLILSFDKKFSQTSANDFVEQSLVGSIGVEKIIIGYDHFFGKDRSGDIELLKKLKAKHHFEIERIEAFAQNETVFSSTEIRLTLASGDLISANMMLGRPYSISGVVKEGEKRGRTIGFPTANIYPQDPNKLILMSGVYAVSTMHCDKLLYGMANIGTRPTFGGEQKQLIEVNFFDFSENLYGKEMSINFHHFLRMERKFESSSQLSTQIQSDESQCRELFNIN